MKTITLVLSGFLLLMACQQKQEKTADTENSNRLFDAEPVTLTMPKEDSLNPEPVTMDCYIDITQKNIKLYVNTKEYYPADNKALEDLLKKNAEAIKRDTMVIRLSSNASNKQVVDVLDMLKITGIELYSIIKLPG